MALFMTVTVPQAGARRHTRSSGRFRPPSELPEHLDEGGLGAWEARGGLADEQAQALPVERLDAPELEPVALAAHQMSSRRELGELGSGAVEVAQTRQRRVVARGALGKEPLAFHGAGRSHGNGAGGMLNGWEGLNVRAKVVPMGAVPPRVKLALMGLAMMLAGCDTSSIESQVAQDAVAQFQIAKRSGDPMQACVHAGLVSAAFLQAKDETSYRKWLAIEKQECTAAGVPQ